MDILTTNGITVTVYNQYLPDHSSPREGIFRFGYFISIENGSPFPVQLLRRHWIIRQASGETHEVKGEGVVGLQPIIVPGDSHEYASQCELYTEMGRMVGTYLMRRCDNDALFEVPIPAFTLVAPFKLN
ncbi:MAG TPA: Co2+/Mg2+ efflux protein ApaG [Saprospiraceae bacterium]|nr:Co2+/Mg2+ efflux protein ApaG [Saprospiraceae bacterium]HND89793.1 Co2+/Mg2+ efflux protein ApaG [Saprospiraceae bacterium]HNG89899.1 Co2+/Mg2+ efflux protein ApaG [Saprospiraceae bacterium]